MIVYNVHNGDGKFVCCWLDERQAIEEADAGGDDWTVTAQTFPDSTFVGAS